ncbi:hypothetical protein BDR07DRAFT_1458961 [Suillus spraguei]|nr:hypothetical protein BDR07DRAFT_1458961 [Suillus spraguei]
MADTCSVTRCHNHVMLVESTTYIGDLCDTTHNRSHRGASTVRKSRYQGKLPADHPFYHLVRDTIQNAIRYLPILQHMARNTLENPDEIAVRQRAEDIIQYLQNTCPTVSGSDSPAMRSTFVDMKETASATLLTVFMRLCLIRVLVAVIKLAFASEEINVRPEARGSPLSLENFLSQWNCWLEFEPNFSGLPVCRKKLPYRKLRAIVFSDTFSYSYIWCPPDLERLAAGDWRVLEKGSYPYPYNVLQPHSLRMWDSPIDPRPRKMIETSCGSNQLKTQAWTARNPLYLTMSIPPVTKDISEHRKAGSVAAPTDKAAKEADVSGKNNFYGMIEAFCQGSMPDNHQIDEILQYLLKTLPSDKNKLSPDGRKLVQDACKIIETAHLIVTEKNVDEFFQNFIWNTRDIPFDNAKMDPRASPFSRPKIDEDRQTAIRHLRTILFLILTKSEVRKLLSDLSVIGRDILAKGVTAGDGSQKPARKSLAGDVLLFIRSKITRSEAGNVEGAGPETSYSETEGKKRERCDQFIYRGKKFIIECQKRNDYKDAIRWLLGEVEQYASYYGQIATGHGKERSSAITQDRALNAAMSELRTLLERFANCRSMNGIFDASNALIDDARCDDELRNWSYHLNTYIHKVLFEAGFVLKYDCNREGNEILESGRHFWDQKYKEHFNNLFDAIGKWFAAMEEDPLNKRFGEDWTRLMRDLLFDSEGSLKLKADLWSDIKNVIWSTMIEKYTDDALDIVVENLSLGRNLFPNFISMEGRNFLNFSPAIPDERHHEFTITLAQMQADMRDAAFYFRNKNGLWDSGIADVILGGQGMTVTIHLVSTDGDCSSVFKVKDVHVKYSRFRRHDKLYKILKSPVTTIIKKHMEKVVAQAIRTGLEYLDGQFVSVRDCMEETKMKEELSLRQLSQEDESASIKTSKSNSHFKVVYNRRDSMVQVGHPAG